jgi:hypothetical protein
MATNEIPEKTCRLTNRLHEIITDMDIEDQIHLLDALDKSIRKERRTCSRKRCFMPVTYTIQGKAYHDFVRNISPGGMYITSTNPFEAGHQLFLEISIPKIRQPVKVCGKIAWIGDQGFGVQIIWQTNI